MFLDFIHERGHSPYRQVHENPTLRTGEEGKK
jgi:hypothetical protein